jgi:NADH-quinone oxidoreductase subunit A
MGPSSLIVLILAGVAFSVIAIMVARVLTKGTTNVHKGEPYECGIPTRGKTWMQLNVGYYLFALVFLIFDVELVFLYPWAVVAKSTGWLALVEIILFFFVLFLGFLYAHRKGALKWV